MIEAFKFLIQGVALERDENGKVIGERTAQTVAAYSVEQAVQVMTQFQREIEQLNQEGTQDGREQEDNGRAEGVVAERASAGGVHLP